ncbi:MAG TPA: BTAD domain-containing putative transcriptional regulator [Aquihabitans sp.]|jgi:DNA-binding SARP family transcriptional activator|nr:BTAD domain-containing putative transcriptional regulator [Aquihabitans sp.]
MTPGSTPPPATSLEISVLGPLRARRDGADLVLGGRRQRSVLARLALARGETVGAERIVDDLWGGEPPRSASNTLQSYVSNLRRILGPDPAGGGPVIERVGDAYRLRVPADGLTSERFERLARDAPDGPAGLPALEEALGLWHGSALADVADEPWAQGDAVRLEELRLAAQERRFDALLAAGRHAVVVGDLDAAALAHPLRERFTAQLVLALYRCGRQAEALRAYDRTRRHLGEELGLEPGPELVELADAVLAQDPALAAAPDTPPDVDPDEPAGAAADPPPPDWTTGVLPLPRAVDERRARSAFVGRDAELELLEREWADVVAGNRRLVTVAGEPGVGKTRLTQRLARRVHDDGGHVLWGRCVLENLIAYQPVAEALRTAVASLHPEVVRSLIDPRPALGLLLQQVTTPDAPGGEGGAERSVRAERFELYEALADLLGEVSGPTPVLLVVDDLQWADTSTLTLLEQVLRHDRTGRLLVVATVRRPAGRPTPDVDRFLADLRRDHRLGAVELGGFGVEEVAALLDERGVALEHDAVDALRDRTAGNPFFIESLVDAGGDLVQADPRALPDSVRDVLDQRLAALEPVAARVLTAGAVIGLRIDLGLLGDVVAMAPDALLDVIDDAVARGLLVEDEELGWVAFPHALVRQALVARTTRNREAQLHLATADVLEDRPDVLDRPATIAQHLLAAGPLCPPVRAASAALAAGRATFTMLADAEARTWADRALELLGGAAPAGADEGPHAELITQADLLVAATSRNLADVDVAGAAIARVADRARRTGDRLLLARAAQESAQLDAGVGFSFGAVDEELVALLQEALDGLPADRPAERSSLLSWLSIAITGADDQPRQVTTSAEAWALAQEVPDRPDVLAIAAYARRLALAGPAGLDDRRVLGPTMIRAAQEAGWSEMEVVGLLFSVVDLLEEDRVDDSLAMLEQLRRRLAEGDRPMFDVYVHFLDGGFALLRGDVAAAEAHSTTALSIGEAAHGGNATQGWAAQQFMIALYHGQMAALEPVVADLVAEYPTMPAWKAALAMSRVNAGRLDDARAAYADDLDGDDLPLNQSPTWYSTVAQLAEVAWNVGDRELARRLLPLLEPIGGHVAITGMGVICMGHVARYLGLVLATLGRDDEALVALSHAVVRAEACGWEPFVARTLAERAVVLGRQGTEEASAAAEVDRRRAEALAARLGIVLSLRDTGQAQAGAA